MDPWPAPYQNSNGYWWPEKIWQELPSNIVIFTVSTLCYTKGPYKEGILQTSDMLLPLSSNAASPLRCRINLFNDASSHLLTDGNKSHITTYYNTSHQDWVGSLSFPSLQTKDKFCKSCIKQQWTTQHNFHIDGDRELPFHWQHSRTASRIVIMWHTTVNFNTMYISLSLFISCLFPLYALMYKYRLKNGVMKLNSALKDKDTDLLIGTQTRLRSCAVTGIEGTRWSPSIWCRKPRHPYIPQQTVMDPWPAPYQKWLLMFCIWPENI
jgi:hypothetical protein